MEVLGALKALLPMHLVFANETVADNSGYPQGAEVTYEGLY
jgi:hypothetical protein